MLPDAAASADAVAAGVQLRCLASLQVCSASVLTDVCLLSMFLYLEIPLFVLHWQAAF